MFEARRVPETRRRILAFLTDEGVRGLFFLPALMRPSQLELWLLCWLLSLAFRALCLQFVGATPGKQIFSLQVVSLRGPGQEALSWGQSLIRPLADDLSVFFGLLPRSVAILRLDRRHLSDVWAETKVIQIPERVSAPRRHFVFWVVFLIFELPSFGFSAFEIVERISPLFWGR